ncbi:two-component system, sporulation sensor kinase D [Cytobacillus eiseniae]|uniref:histidine kinase n=1 Tax=Cytobacillus eiseniae TaxID=762947 RepID=A0ABS4RAK4_9BACI|nr:ATP-binding protein [Cytobacillus eiseniae]MBP2239923.1 two-component system, sporulation sensor kinase D [Cytobacillus eiseniae]
MKKHKNNYYLYIVLVIIPIVICISYQLNTAIKKDNEERKAHAIWIASIHQKSWDQLISETVTSLDILELTAETVMNTPEKMQPLLQRTHWRDSRYGGLYLLDPEGTVLTGSNEFLKNTNLSNNDYIMEISQTRDLIISNQQETLINGQEVIGIGEPVIDNSGQLIAILIAHLRVDYIQNIMRMLTPDTDISIINSSGTIILDINKGASTERSPNQSISLPIERLPWSIKVEISKRDMNEIIQHSILTIFQIIFIFHILFLVFKYFMLKRRTAMEHKENELQKLELVGTLAASTAHEIRNPLTGIKGLIQLLSEKYTNSQDQYYFSVINDEINRINEIVSEFLILGKPTAQKTDIVDLRIVIMEIEPLIYSEANLTNIHYQSSIPEKPLLVDCTKDQLKQVLLNLTKNAFESMQAGGQLSINLIELSNKCHVKITDTGTGIPDDVIDKIFQPFYTSKQSGTGLGLVVCKRIIQSFGGEINLTSKVQKGTEVDIFLPLTK